MKKLAILGSTGSIGTQTLEVVRENGDIQVLGLAAGSNIVSAVIGTDLWVNALDRAIGLVVAYAIIRVIPDRTLIKYALGDKYTKKKA